MSAEYGRTGGAVINMVHRSGTSEFHGVLYEFLRNNVFDANNFFNNARNIKRPVYKQHDFGFSAGGKRWQRRNKLATVHAHCSGKLSGTSAISMRATRPT